ncbi:unnamed protein product [Protopolystoma xenopodis]|uniref:Cyclin N-terminal domain-containing protein n=1 Tax=Protopolystoma xenopodis TaxID=117903 RepID=A0A448XT61_9PLAT|nr:unnamed protein product [Protopolystoma xenopodis]
MLHSVMDFHPREMMLTCLYLACKAADFPIGIEAFITRVPRNQERYAYFILNSELFLMEALHYDLWIYTPYRALTGLIVDLVAFQVHLNFVADMIALVPSFIKRFVLIVTRAI